MTVWFFGGCEIDEDEATGDFDEAPSGSEVVKLWRAFEVDEDADEKTDEGDGRGKVNFTEETTGFKDVLDICEADDSVTPMVVIAVAFPSNCKGCELPRVALQSQTPFTPSRVRVPFKVPQQYECSVAWSQLSMPRAARDLSVHPYSLANLELCLRDKPCKQKAGHADERHFGSVQLPRP